MRVRLGGLVALALAGLALELPEQARAQTAPDDEAASAPASEEGGDVASSNPAQRPARSRVMPYIEAQQVVLAELSGGNGVYTWSTLAAGLDAQLNGRNTNGALSLRYERRFSWNKDTISDADTLSGVARASTALISRALTLEGGATASRMGIENNGATATGREFANTATQLYSLYGGPKLETRVGQASLESHYRIGYTRLNTPDRLVLAPGQVPIDLFDEGLSQSAAARIALDPGEPLPIGLALSGGWDREDVSNLDQRIEDQHVSGDVIVPVGGGLSLVGSIGYEHVEVSGRDAVINSGTGFPEIGSNGRLVTDKTQPRQRAFYADGVIWDGGILWKPSRRTTLEARVGRRYGSTRYTGNLSYQPNAWSALNVTVYDSINGFGGMINNALASLPTAFQVSRNPLTGELGACVMATGSATAETSPCLASALSSARSAAFRSRGVAASFSVQRRRLQYGISAGYDHRKYIAAPGTVLGVVNGLVDKNTWVSAHLNGRIDANSGFVTTAWTNWYKSGDAFSGNSTVFGASAGYNRALAPRLVGTVAVGIDGINRQRLPDAWNGRVLVGLRYSF